MFDEKNKYINLETEYIKEEIEKCENPEELKDMVFPKLRTQQTEWSRKIQDILKETKLTQVRFCELCGVSRVTLNKWCKGSIPKNRETFLKIGMTAGYSIDKINQLLQRYGRYPALYSKSLEDCVCMYVISHGYGEESIEKYQSIVERIKKSIICENNMEEESDIVTEKFDEKLSVVSGEEELERFIAENIAVFTNAYHKLYAYVKMKIAVNYMNPSYADSVYDMAVIQEWSSSLRRCVSEIRQNKWYPTRNKIISLGLHLSMDHEEIDEMLMLAHMEPLCAKNIFESVIIFILEDASLNDKLDLESEDYNPDWLCEYARKVLDFLNIPELEDFMSELPEVDDGKHKKKDE